MSIGSAAHSKQIKFLVWKAKSSYCSKVSYWMPYSLNRILAIMLWAMWWYSAPHVQRGGYCVSCITDYSLMVMWAFNLIHQNLLLCLYLTRVPPEHLFLDLQSPHLVQDSSQVIHYEHETSGK